MIAWSFILLGKYHNAIKLIQQLQLVVFDTAGQQLQVPAFKWVAFLLGQFLPNLVLNIMRPKNDS
jgi:hypothetical protein